jgi:hypothetical protein
LVQLRRHCEEQLDYHSRSLNSWPAPLRLFDRAECLAKLHTVSELTGHHQVKRSVPVLRVQQPVPLQHAHAPALLVHVATVLDVPHQNLGLRFVAVWRIADDPAHHLRRPRVVAVLRQPRPFDPPRVRGAFHDVVDDLHARHRALQQAAGLLALLR